MREHPPAPLCKGSWLARPPASARLRDCQNNIVLIPSVMALRETAMTAPLGQQGEPLRFAGSSRNVGGNPWKEPRQCEHWRAMTSVIRTVPQRRLLFRGHPVSSGSGFPAGRTESPAALGLPLPRKGAFFRPLSCFLTSDLVCSEGMKTYNSK